MRRGIWAALAAATMASPALAATPPGIWANPANSVHVSFKPCGRALCGRVVWASAKAQADARAGGTDPLVGVELFRDLVEEDRGFWRGSVFVPDIGQTLAGTIEQIDAKTIRGEGCLFAGFGCKQQIWTRVK